VPTSLEPAQLLSRARSSLLPPGEPLLFSDSARSFLKLVTETQTNKTDAIQHTVLKPFSLWIWIFAGKPWCQN